MKQFWLIGIIISLGICSCGENFTNQEAENYLEIPEKFDYTQLRLEIEDSLKELEDCEEIPGQHVGWAGTTPKSWHTYSWFVDNINLQESVALLAHSNVTIRALAVEGLYINKDPFFGQRIIDAFYDDSTLISRQSGCMVEQYTLFEHYLGVFNGAEGFYRDTVRFNENERKTIDSLVMTTKDSSRFNDAKEILGISF